MRTNHRRVAARFEVETCFEVRPSSAAPFRAAQEMELERLKSRLLQERLTRVNALRLSVPLRRAAEDAAALAWVTAYPSLVFPALFDEKARAALLQVQRQLCVRERSRELLVV